MMSSFLDTCLAQFDDLQQQGLLHFQEPKIELTIDEFPLQFRISPQRSANAQSHHGNSVERDSHGISGSSTLIKEFPDHLMQLDHSCTFRPQFLLQRQKPDIRNDRVTFEDFAASFQVLSDLGPNALASYICQPDSVRAHPRKHVQVILKPDPKNYIMWPDRAFAKGIRTLDDGPPLQFSVPYLARFRIVEDVDAKAALQIYQSLLLSLEMAIDEPVTAHNVIWTKDWICVVPRRKSHLEGSPVVDGIGMMGIICVGSEEERKQWDKVGRSAYLTELGYPPD